MRLRQFGYALALGVLAALPARGALVISEVLFNEVGSDVTGEWIEIFNNGAAAIDLTNYKIGDEETFGGTGAGEAMHRFPAGASIAPGAVQIVAVSAMQFSSLYGFLPTYEINATDATVHDMSTYSTYDPDGGVLNMANGGDHAFILDEADTAVDAVNWDNDTFLNPGIVSMEADGQSYERKNVFINTGTADDWQLGPNPDGSTAVQRSTPGVARVPEPASLALALGAAAMGLAFRRR